jgi:hypothetical protein
MEAGMYADEPSGIRKNRGIPGSVQAARSGEAFDTKRIREDINDSRRIQGKTETTQTSEEIQPQKKKIKRVNHG